MFEQCEDERDELLYQLRMSMGFNGALVLVILLMACKDLHCCPRNNKYHPVPHVEGGNDELRLPSVMKMSDVINAPHQNEP